MIEGLAERIDALAYHPAFRAVFPRFGQFAIWHFCAADGPDICNGNQIDDRNRCCNRGCAASTSYDRVRLVSA